MNRTYRFRLKPTESQYEALLRQAGMVRFVFNWGLASRKEHYDQTATSLSLGELCNRLTDLKRQDATVWLKGADAQALQQSLRDLDRAYANFFAKRARFPHFKSRHRDTPSFRVPQRVRLDDGKVYCPKVGWVKIRQSQAIDDTTKSATFKQDACGHWYVTLVTEFAMPEVGITAPTSGVGIDVGLESFIALSDGTKVPAPQFFRKAQAHLARQQRRLARKHKGSRNRDKQRRRVAQAYAKIRNQRQDFLHKLSTSLVKQYDLVAAEDLNVKGLARTKLAKSVLDASWSEFTRQLEYKCLWNRKHFVRIDRFFPSSKTCSACGSIQGAMPLSVRQWVCQCGAAHDRDTNAAKNIFHEGFKAVGQTASACGDVVRLSI